MSNNDIPGRVLNLLIDKLEKSKSSNPRVCLVPNEVIPDYGSPTASIGESLAFEDAVNQLEAEGFVIARKGEDADSVNKIFLVLDKKDAVYERIHRRKKSDLDSEFISLLNSYITGNHEIVDLFCKDQISKIMRGNKPYCAYDQMPVLLGVLSHVLLNDTVSFEREFSIKLFFQEDLKHLLPDHVSKSKYFTSFYRKKIASIIAEYGDYDSVLSEAETATEREHAILSVFNIVPNETIVYVKGNGILSFQNGDTITTHSNEMTPLLSYKLDSLASVSIQGNSVMTVENLTSFKMISGSDFYIYVAGYHKDGQNNLIRHLMENKQITEWKHFGDLDPWGFQILNNLRKRTGADFKPWKMDLKDYLDPSYASARISLTDEDRDAAENMIKNNIFPDIMKVMLREGYKLEQEAISFRFV